MALILASLATVFFGSAIVTGKRGLRSLDARAGAAISIPTATLLLVAAAPFFLQLEGVSLRPLAVFVLAGVFFPVLCTVLTFASNDRLGPALTSATIAAAVPLFSLAAAALLLDESIPPRAALATCGVVLGVGLLTWRGDRMGARRLALLALPLAAALTSGLARAAVKTGLAEWPNPFAAALIAYLVSSVVILAVARLRGAGRARAGKEATLWFAATGALNGAGVLALYGALNAAPLSLVAAIVGAYPLVTLALAALLLREESIGRRELLGVGLTVAAIAYLATG